jgi:hypothetical protein
MSEDDVRQCKGCGVEFKPPRSNWLFHDWACHQNYYRAIDSPGETSAPAADDQEPRFYDGTRLLPAITFDLQAMDDLYYLNINKAILAFDKEMLIEALKLGKVVSRKLEKAPRMARMHANADVFRERISSGRPRR